MTPKLFAMVRPYSDAEIKSKPERKGRAVVIGVLDVQSSTKDRDNAADAAGERAALYHAPATVKEGDEVDTTQLQPVLSDEQAKLWG